MDVSSSPAYSPRLPQLAKYDVLEEIGHGGMATVYRAHDSRLSRDVAVKILHAHLRDSDEVGTRFATEAKAVAKLRHPNIVEVYDVSGEEDHERFLVVELVRGKNLRALLREHKKLPAEVAVALAIEVLQALVHAHAHGVIHRDIKPENVMVEHTPPDPTATPVATGERVRVKLMDFGIAKLLDAQGVTATGQVLGSPAHMAPEQIEGGEVDARADVYAVGVLLYECLVGDLPFRGTNPAQVLRRVLEGQFEAVECVEPTAGKRLGDLVQRTLAQDLDARPASAAALRDLLLHELARLGIETANGGAKGVLEAYFDDPEGFVKEHNSFLLKRLCELGAKELEGGGSVLAAAADYNRALALDPHNAELIKTVTRLRRGQARGKFLRKTAAPAAFVLLLGISAYGATRYFSHAPEVDTPPAPVVSAPPSAPPPKPKPSAAPSASVAAPPASTPIVHTPPKPVRRALTVASLSPTSGVQMSIDGSSKSIALETDKRIEIDGAAHELRFFCLRNLCEPSAQSLAAGDKDAPISVSLKLREADFQVVGQTGHTYRIDEYQVQTVSGGNLRFRPRAGTQTVRVTELESSRSMMFQLVAGRTDPLRFVAD